MGVFRKSGIFVLKGISFGLCSILGILATFSGCMYGPGPMAYGMPYADYLLLGTVKSSDEKKPVQGLLVALRDTLDMSYIIDSTRTDSQGKYVLEFQGEAWENTLKIEVRDLDGNQNGLFVDKDTLVTINQEDLADVEKTVDIEVERDDNE